MTLCRQYDLMVSVVFIECLHLNHAEDPGVHEAARGANPKSRLPGQSESFNRTSVVS